MPRQVGRGKYCIGEGENRLPACNFKRRLHNSLSASTPKSKDDCGRGGGKGCLMLLLVVCPFLFIYVNLFTLTDAVFYAYPRQENNDRVG